MHTTTRNGEDRKKKKRKRKRSGRKGRVHRGVPTFPQHNVASFLHMPAGGCRLNRQGCALCVCPRGFRPYLYSSSSLQSLDEIRRKHRSSSRFPELQPAKPASRRSASGRRHAVLLVLRCVAVQMLNYIPIYSPRVLRHPQ